MTQFPQDDQEFYYNRIADSLTDLAKQQDKNWSETDAKEATDNLLAFAKLMFEISKEQIRKSPCNASKPLQRTALK